MAGGTRQQQYREARMASSKDVLRRQRRRELDARRSKSRVRLGACLQRWGQLKDQLGFSLHSELAQYLLESYFSKVCVKCSASVNGDAASMLTTAESLHHLVLMVHNHGQQCPFPPTMQPGLAATRGQGEDDALSQAGKRDSTLPTAAELRVKYICEVGHGFAWCPTRRQAEEESVREREKGKPVGDATQSGPTLSGGRGKRGAKDLRREIRKEVDVCTFRTRNYSGQKHGEAQEGAEQTQEESIQSTADSGEDKTSDAVCAEHTESETGNDTGTALASLSPGERLTTGSNDMETENSENVCDENQTPSPNSTIPKVASRGTQRSTNHCEEAQASRKHGRMKRNRLQLGKDEESQIGGKKKRKATPKVILPCEFEGCGKIFSSRQYLNHHMKYQHFHQKTFICSHSSCGKTFNFKKHLKEHEKLHSNQRDYICEFCARAFRTSSNLIIHRRIHTGEKPLQCEVCGFTCRQKASLNWHMKKHNVESGYRFPCEICGRRFEKRDNVTAHCSKSHPSDPSVPSLAPSPLPGPSASAPESP